MNNTLKQISIGIVCKDMMDYNRWVNMQSYDTLRKYFPIVNTVQAANKYDEIVVTTTASANPNYIDIYIKLNGAYAKAKREPKS